MSLTDVPIDLVEYAFAPSPDDASVWTRKCYGLETFASCMSENLDGFPFLTTTIATRLTPSRDRHDLEPAVRDAWIALRHALPAIAVKSSRLPPPDNRFVLDYRAPKAFADVESWANETVLFEDAVKDVYEVHKDLKDGRWWRPAISHWVGELHVSPTAEGWQFTVVFNHSSNDGRSGFGVLNEFLRKLIPILQGAAKPVASLEWGEEVKRLPPAACVIWTSANAASAPPEVPAPRGLADKTAWDWKPIELPNPVHRDISALVTLPADTTAKLHAISKKNGRTITHVVTALSALAHAEAGLTAIAKESPERFKEAAKSFLNSEVYNIVFTFVNYRFKFPEEWKRLDSETPGPLSTFDGMPLLLPMDPIRKFFTINRDATSVDVATTATEAAFWNDLVAASADCWKDYDLSLHGFASREIGSQDIIHNFPTGILDTHQLIISSIGDLGRLHLFDPYRPSLATPATPVIVDQVICGQRMRVPALMNLLWEYDGKLTCQWFTGGEWTTEEHLRAVVKSFEKWVGLFIV